MKAFILDVGAPASCHPLTCTRPLGACAVAGHTVRVCQEQALAQAGLETAPSGTQAEGPGLYLAGDAWVEATVLRQFAGEQAPKVLKSAAGTVLAWLHDRPITPTNASVMRAAAASAFPLVYPWDLLRLNEWLVGGLQADDIRGQVSPRAEIEGHLVLGEDSRILPGVFIEGNVVIGRHCKIGPNAYLRGCTAIGDGCHIGQAVEIKNSIVMDDVWIGHLSYCGDSIVGEQANLGAGTITANSRHDGREHRSLVRGVLVETQRRKFGAIFGDRVHTGIHTSVYPGRKLWPDTATRPGTVVQYDLLQPGLV